MSRPIIFSGPVNMRLATFKAKYAVLVERAMELDQTIRVGCALGCDKDVQDLCAAAGYENVEVFIPSEIKEENIYCASDKFRRVVIEGGFEKRDRAMWDGCKNAYAHLSQYAGAASGAAANLIACAARAGAFGPNCKDLDGYAVVQVLRDHLEKFDASLQSHVIEKEAERYSDD